MHKHKCNVCGDTAVVTNFFEILVLCMLDEDAEIIDTFTQ